MKLDERLVSPSLSHVLISKTVVAVFKFAYVVGLLFDVSRLIQVIDKGDDSGPRSTRSLSLWPIFAASKLAIKIIIVILLIITLRIL